MPYNIPNETPKQTRWMERCVNSVMESNPDYDESRAIAICKATLKKNDWKVPDDSESELSMREELWELEKKIMEAVGGPVRDVFPAPGPYLVDVFDDFVIVEMGNKLFKLPWLMSDDEVKVDWKNAVEVERKTVYEPSESEKRNVNIPRVNAPNSGRRIGYGNIVR